MRSKSKTVKRCICGKTRRQYKRDDIVVGLGLFGVFLLISAMLMDPAAPFFFAALLVVAYIVAIVVNLFKRHSFICSVRKSALDILGNFNFDFLGGGWS